MLNTIKIDNLNNNSKNCVKNNAKSNFVESGSTKKLAILGVLYYIKKVRYKEGGIQKMEYKKSLFGKTIIDKSDSDDLKENEKIELEYYETHNLAEKSEREYGIEIVKTKEKNEKFNIESKVINNISNEEQKVNKLLNILMLNKVTPVSVDDIISDISEEKMGI